MKKMLFGTFIWIIVLPSFSQNKKLDSLWAVYNNESEADTNRLKAIGNIAWYYKSNNPDTAIILAKQQLQLAQVAKQKIYEANALNIIGTAFRIKGDYSKAIEYTLRALKTYEEKGDKMGIGACYNNLGNVYTFQSKHPEALEYFLRGLKIFQETGNKKKIGTCYANIGNVYGNQANYPKALEYCLRASKISEEIKDKMEIGNSFNSVGGIYRAQANYPKAIEYYLKSLKQREEIGDKNGIGAAYLNIGSAYFLELNYSKALELYLKSLKIFEEIGNKLGIGNCYIGLGAAYLHLSNDSKAIEYTLKSLRLNKEMDNKEGMAYSYRNLSEFYIKVANYKHAIKYGDSALQVSKETGNIRSEQEVYQTLATVYCKTGQYKEALENHIKFKAVTDSIFNKENSKQLGDMKTKFEVEKKEAELKVKAEAEKEKTAAVTKEEKKTQKIITGSVVFGLALVLVFSVIIFRRLQVTRKQKFIIEEQKTLVELKSKETEEQKHLIEEKHKEITDSINYAERIQRSFLATKELLNENLNGHFVFFQPKDVVSGDFYWATKLKNNNFILATADSTGHGVPGAIMSILNISSLEKAVEHGLVEPSEIFNHTRKTIIERLKKDGSEHGGKDGMDCSLISFDFINNKLTYTAANNPVWIVRSVNSSLSSGAENGTQALPATFELIELAPDKMPVGKHDKDHVPFNQHTIDLQKNDVIYAITDGYPDQFGGEKGKKFMSKNLKELLKNNAHLSMPEQKNILSQIFKDWVGNLEQVDDVTIIGIRI